MSVTEGSSSYKMNDTQGFIAHMAEEGRERSRPQPLTTLLGGSQEEAAGSPRHGPKVIVRWEWFQPEVSFAMWGRPKLRASVWSREGELGGPRAD